MRFTLKPALAAVLGLSLACACNKSGGDAAAGELPDIKTTNRRSYEMQFQGRISAPDFPADAQWLNVDAPLKLADLSGKIVLLDFWTYCCINCIHVIPDLKRLEAEFPDELVVIGVHSAKFENERELNSIRGAVLRYEIEHPVVNDPDMRIWSSYAVRSWPTVVLIDPAGKVIGQSSGEGVYDKFQPVLAQAIKEFDAAGLLDRRKEVRLALERDKVQQSLLSFPGKLDSHGETLAISDSNHNRIVLTSLSGEVLDVIGGGAFGLADGDFETALFARPQGVCFSADGGRLYIADTESHCVRVADLAARSVTTLAGTGRQARSYPPRPGVGTDAELSSPWDIHADGGTLYVAMAGSHQLWAIDAQSGATQSFAGTGGESIDDAERTRATLAQPSGITASAPRSGGGVLYFADSETSAIRSADYADGGMVRTLIGEGLFEFGDVDGRYPGARLQHAVGLAYHAGLIYIADTYNDKIRVLDPARQELSTLIGTGEPGLLDGAAGAAQLNEPCDVAFAGGKMYIADTNNNAVRVYDPASGLVSTLRLSGAKLALLTGAQQTPGAPMSYPEPARSAELAAADLAPGGTLTLQLRLPAGSQLTAGAPTALVPEGGSAIAADEAGATFSLTPAPDADRVEARVYVYYCDTDGQGLCYFDSVRISLSLTRAAGAPAAAQVELPIGAPT